MTTQPKGVTPGDAPPVEEHALPEWPPGSWRNGDAMVFCGMTSKDPARLWEWFAKKTTITRPQYAAQLAAVERVRELEMELEHTENALGAAQLVGIKGMEIEDELRTERDIARARVAELEAERLLFGPIEHARKELEDAGMDPDEVGAKGAEFVAGLLVAQRARAEKAEGEWTGAEIRELEAASDYQHAMDRAAELEAQLTTANELVATREGELAGANALLTSMVGLGAKAHGADPYHEVCQDMHELGALAKAQLKDPS